MENRIEGTHMDFLQMITEKRAKLLKDGTRETPGSEGIIDAEVTQLTRIYIEKRKATVVQWVALRLLFEVCMWDTGGRSRKVWGSQEATEKQLWATLEDSLEAKSIRRCGGEMGM